jgi:hypothetical protein
MEGIFVPQPYPLSSSRLTDIASFIERLADSASTQILRFQGSNTGQFPAQIAVSGSAPSSQPIQPAPTGGLMVASNFLLIGGVGLLVVAMIVWMVQKK